MKIIIAFSCFRIESLGMLRLRLCGTNLWSFPMKPKHFFFIKAIGWHHLVSSAANHTS